jgi:hypothetical protein
VDLQIAFDTQQKLDPRQTIEPQLPIQIGVYTDLNVGPARLQLQSQRPDDLKQLTRKHCAAT